MHDFPHYYKEKLIIGTDDIQNHVVTGWSLPSFMVQQADPGTYGVLGPLYSPMGINFIIRNWCLRPQKWNLVLCGIDGFNHGLEILHTLITNGMDTVPEGILHPEIDPAYIEAFRQSMSVVDMRNQQAQPEKLRDVLQKLESPDPALILEPQVFPDHRPHSPGQLPWPIGGQVIQASTFADAHIQALQHIHRFGEVKKSQHVEQQKECLNLILVVHEDPDAINFDSDKLLVSRAEIDAYKPQILTGEQYESFEYTYGQRMRSHFEIDQVMPVVQELKEAPYTRRAVISLWDPKKDAGSKNPPCIVTIDFLTVQNTLCMTVFIRSNDMMEAWPLNAIALRHLQKQIAQQVDLTLGPLTTISHSAHVYERHFSKMQSVVDKHKLHLWCTQDLAGSFVITVNQEQKEILVKHLSPNGTELQIFSNPSADRLREQLAPFISGVSHGIDIGIQLGRAEEALRKGLTFNQDNLLG